MGKKAKGIVFEEVINNLMKLTESRSLGNLGKWILKEDSRYAELYIPQQKGKPDLSQVYGRILARCVEESIDLNAVFNNAAQAESISRLLSVENQVQGVLKSNSILISENAEMAKQFREMSSRYQEISLKFLELANKKR